MKKFFNFMHKYAAVLYLICALTSLLTKEYTSTSLWICLFCLELANRDDESNNSGQSEDGLQIYQTLAIPPNTKFLPFGGMEKEINIQYKSS